MKNIRENNLAFIDGQNLHLGTTQNGWKVDHNKLRIYLKDKYHVIEAYYFWDMFRKKSKVFTVICKKQGSFLLFLPQLRKRRSGILRKTEATLGDDFLCDFA